MGIIKTYKTIYKHEDYDCYFNYIDSLSSYDLEKILDELRNVKLNLLIDYHTYSNTRPISIIINNAHSFLDLYNDYEDTTYFTCAHSLITDLLEHFIDKGLL